MMRASGAPEPAVAPGEGADERAVLMSPSWPLHLSVGVPLFGALLAILAGPADVERLGDHASLVHAIAAARPTTLVMSSEAIRDEDLVAAASRLHLGGLRVRALDDFYERQFAKVPLSELSKAWFLFDVAEI